jgi:hypothetical protein
MGLPRQNRRYPCLWRMEKAMLIISGYRQVGLLHNGAFTTPMCRYYQALTLAEELGMRPLHAHCHLGLGILYAKIDRREQARTELSTAIALYQDMEMTFWLPQVEAALAQVERK